MTLKQLLENRLEDLEAEAKRVCENDEGAYYAFYELEIEALKKEIAKAEQEVNMLIKNTLNISLRAYQLKEKGESELKLSELIILADKFNMNLTDFINRIV